MLNLRSGMVLTAAALCLWALYSLLTSLKEPGLLRSQKAAVLKGCDVLTDADIRRTCVPLMCQKALLDAKLVPWDARFSTQVQRPSAADVQFEVVAGEVHTNTPSSFFMCLVRESQVSVRRMVSSIELEELIRTADEAPDELSSS